MTDASRDELLERIFADPEGTTQARLRHQIIEGLVFAQRPIRAAAREVTRRYKLGPRGSFILGLIASGISYPHELASLLKIGRSLVTSELARLTAAGLVVASPGEQDRRRSALALTPTGERASNDVRDAITHILTRNLKGYSVEEVALFARMLRDIRRLEPGEHENGDAPPAPIAGLETGPQS